MRVPSSRVKVSKVRGRPRAVCPVGRARRQGMAAPVHRETAAGRVGPEVPGEAPEEVPAVGPGEDLEAAVPGGVVPEVAAAEIDKGLSRAN